MPQRFTRIGAERFPIPEATMPETRMGKTPDRAPEPKRRGRKPKAEAEPETMNESPADPSDEELA